MSLTLNDNFSRGGFDLIACQSPLVLDVTLGNAGATAASGDVTATIQGQTSAENTVAYTFNMAYVSSAGSGPYTHEFKLDITDIIRKICNDPSLQDDTTSGFDTENRLAPEIRITITSAPETPVVQDNWYAHGFNQVNNPDSSCLVDFADKDTEAIIPIVPGAPMLFYIWRQTTSVSGSFIRIVDDGSFNAYVGTVAQVKGLIQGYDATILNQGLDDDYENGIKEYTFQCGIHTPLTIQGAVTLVAFKELCEGDVLLSWLNRFGVYSYMAFERFPTIRGEQKHIGSFDLEVTDIADLQSRTKSRGFTDVRNVISAVAKSVPTEYFDAIEDLFYSMDVYYFTGTLPEYEFDPAEWLRVKVRGTLVERKKHSFENVRVDILLPEKYTQIR